MNPLPTSVAIVISAAVIPAALAQPLCSGGTIACRQIVVRLKPNESIEPLSGAYGASVLRSISTRRTFLLETAPQANLQAIITGLANDPRVLWVEPNYVQLAPGGNTQSFFLSMIASQQQFAEQYAVPLLQIDQAHAVSTGAGSIIAVLDTGLDATHDWFAGRIAAGGWNFVEDSPDFADVGNNLDDNNNGLVDEMTGHGTMVAGLCTLVAPSAQVLALRILNSDGVGTAFAMAQGIDAAVAAGARIINISAGASLPSQAVQEAVTDALAADRVVIASVGNCNREAPALHPAALDGVIAVAATDPLDTKAWFSDFGDHVDICAPGLLVFGPVPGNAFGGASGTSFAAPLVSGTAALAASITPSAPAAMIRSVLTTSSADISAANPGYAGKLGAGRVSAFGAVATGTGGTCYANCDGSSAAPVLNVADFSCFLQRFAAGEPYANCDQSSAAPVLNVSDFACFLTRFAAGCN